VVSLDDLDDEFAGWLAEAYEVGQGEPSPARAFTSAAAAPLTCPCRAATRRAGQMARTDSHAATANWLDLVHCWEGLDTGRVGAATVAFVLFLPGTAVAAALGALSQASLGVNQPGMYTVIGTSSAPVIWGGRER
jgi:hypothetical protein